MPPPHPLAPLPATPPLFPPRSYALFRMLVPRNIEPDSELFARLWRVQERVPVVNVFGRVVWAPDEFLLRYASIRTLNMRKLIPKVCAVRCMACAVRVCGGGVGGTPNSVWGVRGMLAEVCVLGGRARRTFARGLDCALCVFLGILEDGDGGGGRCCVCGRF